MQFPFPFYERPRHSSFPINKHRTVDVLEIVGFLKWVVRRDQLAIVEYLNKMTDESFFLVAATGLGKTVAVPVHDLLRQAARSGQSMQPQPKVYVVEPRIPIATDQASFMNSLWETYWLELGERNAPPLFGCHTSQGWINPDAPIQFVTTGIFEGDVDNDRLNPDHHRVIIDEAHVTLEQNPGIELATTLARKAGVTIDYMSATVETSNISSSLGVTNIIRADKQRYPVWKSNLICRLEDSLVEVIAHTLINPQSTSRFFPQREYLHAEATIEAVLEKGRSHGMLVIVNSFEGETGDVQRLAAMVQQAYPKLPVLMLAGAVVRDERRLQEFQQTLQRIDDAHENYLIFATSVVEMGITFANLDYVVTMDSGFEQETIGDVAIPVVGPLGVNSLFQRIGRVGRRRPGIAYISYEAGAAYSVLDDEKLNRPNALPYQPIHFPLANASLMPLAYYLCKQGWAGDQLVNAVAWLDLPSKLHYSAPRMQYLREQVSLLVKLGLSDGIRLTPLGQNMKQWIGRADLAYTTQLQRRFEEGAGLPEVIFWIMAAALSNAPLSTLRAKHDYFVDYAGAHKTLPHTTILWSDGAHEDLSTFRVMTWLLSTAPALFCPTRTSGKFVEEDELARLQKWCSGIGMDARKLQQAGKAMADMLQVFVRVNRESEQFRALFGNVRTLELVSLPWQRLRIDLNPTAIYQQLYGLAGNKTINIRTSIDGGGFEWKDSSFQIKGTVFQDDTPLKLQVGNSYIARIMPSREAMTDAPIWRLTHIGKLPENVQPTVTTAAPPTQSSVKKTSLWQRFIAWVEELLS